MLVGIVKKNAIMQIDFALEAGAQRRQDRRTRPSIEGCIIRFRPIMMTTGRGMLGSVPMALGYGAGGEARRPLGLAVVGGLVVSQLMTLVPDPGGLHLYGAIYQAAAAPDCHHTAAGSRTGIFGLRHPQD